MRRLGAALLLCASACTPAEAPVPEEPVPEARIVAPDSDALQIDSQGTALPFQELLADLGERYAPTPAFMGMRDSVRAVVRDAEALRLLWSRRTTSSGTYIGAPASAPPPVDFEREMLVAVSDGLAGADRLIDIESVTQRDGRIDVAVRHRIVARCPRGAVLHMSTTVVRVPASPLPVRFTERTETDDCTGGPRTVPNGPGAYVRF